MRILSLRKLEDLMTCHRKIPFSWYAAQGMASKPKVALYLNYLLYYYSQWSSYFPLQHSPGRKWSLYGSGFNMCDKYRELDTLNTFVTVTQC